MEQADTTQVEGTEAGGEAAETEAPQFDPSEFTSRFDRLENQLGERLTGIEDGLSQFQQQPEEQQEGQQFAPEEFQIEPDEYGQIDVQQLQERFDQQQQRREEALMERIQGMLDPINERQLERDYAELAEQYPILQDTEKAKPYVVAAQAEAERLSRTLQNPELATRLMDDPEFFETVFLAEMARERGGQETPAGTQQEGQLERGGGAPPEPAKPSVWEELAQQQQGPERLFGF